MPAMPSPLAPDCTEWACSVLETCGRVLGQPRGHKDPSVKILDKTDVRRPDWVMRPFEGVLIGGFTELAEIRWAW